MKRIIIALIVCFATLSAHAQGTNTNLTASAFSVSVDTNGALVAPAPADFRSANDIAAQTALTAFQALFANFTDQVFVTSVGGFVIIGNAVYTGTVSFISSNAAPFDAIRLAQSDPAITGAPFIGWVPLAVAPASIARLGVTNLPGRLVFHDGVGNIYNVLDTRDGPEGFQSNLLSSSTAASTYKSIAAAAADRANMFNQVAPPLSNTASGSRGDVGWSTNGPPFRYEYYWPSNLWARTSLTNGVTELQWTP